MDFSFLLGGNQVQLPDPMQQYARGLTLADMARRVQNSEDDYRSKDIERRANVLAAQAWGQAQQTGDIRSAVADLSNQGEAGALALQKLTAAWRAEQESQAKQEHQRAQTQELTSKSDKAKFEIDRDRSVEVRNMATSIAGSQGPIPDEVIGTFMERARALGVPESVLRQAPMQSDAFRVWTANLADPKTLEEVMEKRTLTPSVLAKNNAAAGLDVARTDALPRQTAAQEMTARASAQSAATGAARLKHDIDQSGKPDSAGVAALRKEFNGLEEVKNYKSVLPIINSARNAPDTPAGDLDLIYSVGKVLDPGSVVREGEMVLVTKSGSPAQRIMGHMNYLRGKGKLTPQQRGELLAMLENRVGSIEEQYNASKAVYSNIAQKNGMPEDQIFSDLQTSAPSKAAGGKDFKSMPDPAQYKGRRIQADDGTIYRSNGTSWVRE